MCTCIHIRMTVMAHFPTGLKGGALISALYAYSRHGDPYVHSLVIHLLNWVFRPLNSMLNSWIFDGELCDVFLEFFVAADASVSQQKLWTAKYSLRHSMLPSFIPTDVAQKVRTYVYMYVCMYMYVLYCRGS